jgi:hypothetical protein
MKTVISFLLLKIIKQLFPKVVKPCSISDVSTLAGLLLKSGEGEGEQSSLSSLSSLSSKKGNRINIIFSKIGLN